MKIIVSLILLLSLIALTFSLIHLQKEMQVVEEKILPASVNITMNNIGFDLNSSALTFGKIIPYGDSTRNVIFQNNYEFPIIVEIESEGEIKKLISFEKEFNFEINETKKIPFFIKAESTENFYEGIIKFKIIRND